MATSTSLGRVRTDAGRSQKPVAVPKCAVDEGTLRRGGGSAVTRALAEVSCVILHQSHGNNRPCSSVICQDRHHPRGDRISFLLYSELAGFLLLLNQPPMVCTDTLCR